MRHARWLVAIAATTMLIQPATAHAAFPGTNGLIAWTRIFLQKPTELWVMNPDGSNKHGLLQNDLSEADPAWSADGQRIAYEAWGSDVDVWVANADGTGQTDLTNDPSAP